ncbi:MAG: bifunctional folylpolyglutamate synthase/dihydrofolate synthase [Planctomycetaceae bacterium]|nr:bifunctional folylpolyglutamate synthase/dihydrofolate synthase [Planctomycetaceae bacterium]
MLAPSFDEAVRLLNDRINLESLQHFSPNDMEGRLEPLRHLLDSFALADGKGPETQYKTIHIAGTKGKGSTCAMLEAILLAQGHRVGRYTSPHLYCFTERLTVNAVPCPQEEFAELFFSVCERIEPKTLQSLTYFELLTLLAFIYFARKKVDVAVLETGLGGRLDATNLCQPDVSVITSISYDHTAQLGPTLADIATEKSGIIKPGIPVVTTALHPEALNVIRRKAQTVDSPFFVLDEHFFVRQTTPQYGFQYMFADVKLDNLSLAMPGTHQIQNAAAAISALLLLGETFDADTIRSGLRGASLPLRLEVIRLGSASPTFVFDGAHNQASVQTLVQTLAEMFPNRRMLLLFGASLGKDILGMFSEIAGRFEHIFLTQSSTSHRRFPPQELRSMLALPDAKVTVLEDCNAAWERCLSMAAPDDVICITGSLYLAAELRKRVRD